MSAEIKHKESDRRGMFYFEDKEGITSELTYSKMDNGILVIDHIETRPDLEGKELASNLVRKCVEFAREHNYKINPLCPFAEVQFDLHKEYQDLRVD